MTNPLFQPNVGPLSPEEELEITRKLAAAYQQSQDNEKRPEFQRIILNVQRKLQDIDDQQS